MNILDAMNDPKVFGRHFHGDSWAAWRAFLAALFGLPLSAEQLKLYRQCAGRDASVTSPTREAWLVCGRRSGKSFVLAVVAVFLACFRDWRRYLGPGERCTVMIVAADRRQARVIMRYCRGLLKAVPMLERVIEGETRESLDLRHRVTIEVHTASFRSTRGYAICAALLDELAFWRQEESTDPDTEIIAAIRPAMATITGAMLLCASSPYARRGALWDAHKRHFAKAGDPVLVWQAPTITMNPTVPAHVITAAYEADPANAASEYGAQFRTDIEGFIAKEAVELCLAPHVYERGPVPGTRYSAFVDPSGGSADSMTLAIGHEQDGVAVLDAIRERKPPFSPEAVVAEFAVLLKSYRVTKVTGDRYAGEWPRERFDAHGIRYEPAAKPKSELYRDLLPAINSRKADLLDHPKLVAQLVGLERRTARGGRDSIDHAPNAHDDVANSLAGLVNALAIGARKYDSSMQWVGGPDPNDPAPTWAQPRSLWQHPSFNLLRGPGLVRGGRTRP
jgi:hypothetical protein